MAKEVASEGDLSVSVPYVEEEEEEDVIFDMVKVNWRQKTTELCKIVIDVRANSLLSKMQTYNEGKLTVAKTTKMATWDVYSYIDRSITDFVTVTGPFQIAN